MFDKIAKVIRKFLSVISMSFLFGQVIVVTYVAFMRYVFKQTPAWGESVALLFMVWFCLLSSALAVGEDIHLKMTLIDEIIPQEKTKFLDIMAVALTLIFGIFMVVYGYKVFLLSNRNIITGIGLPSGIMYAALPVSGILFIIESIDRGRELLCQSQQSQ